MELMHLCIYIYICACELLPEEKALSHKTFCVGSYGQGVIAIYFTFQNLPPLGLLGLFLCSFRGGGGGGGGGRRRRRMGGTT